MAIAGVPRLAGFFCKDEILFETFCRGPPVPVGRRRADVAADRDLHVPPGVPDVPRRASGFTAPPVRSARVLRCTAPTHDASRTSLHTRHSARACPRRTCTMRRRPMALALDRARDWLGRSPATSAFRTRSAATTRSATWLAPVVQRCELRPADDRVSLPASRSRSARRAKSAEPGEHAGARNAR